MNNAKILLIGATVQSAGIGGVTIHIQRLTRWLEKLGVAYDLCDYKTISLWNVIKTIKCHKVVHIHTCNSLLRIILICVAKVFGKKVIFTKHGNLGNFTPFMNEIEKLSVKWSNVPLLINQLSYEKALQWNKHSVLMSAFIPPLEDGYLPLDVVKTIASAKGRGMTVVSTNAASIAFTHDGLEIYGIEFIVNYFKNKSEYFVCISDSSGQYATKYKNMYSSNILIITEPHSFFALMKQSDIMLRATATDGDSLSVKEGLYLNKKVITTDCVDRPNGVVLFKYNDFHSLSAALMNNEQILNDVHNEDTIDSLIKLYNNLMNPTK